MFNKDQYLNEWFYFWSCQNSGLCRSTDGVCLCPDGFTGSQCELKVGNMTIWEFLQLDFFSNKIPLCRLSNHSILLPHWNVVLFWFIHSYFGEVDNYYSCHHLDSSMIKDILLLSLPNSVSCRRCCLIKIKQWH